jgi:regulator of ribonuclease activity A
MNTPDISDKFPNTPFLLNYRPYGNNDFFCGELVTVECPDDNSLVREVLSDDGTDKILFVNGFNSKLVAFIGDNLAQLAIDNNWRGIIVNGCVRDVEVLKQMKLGVYALGTCPKKSLKNNEGEINKPFITEGIEIHSGNWAYVDENGILIAKTKLLI